MRFFIIFSCVFLSQLISPQASSAEGIAGNDISEIFKIYRAYKEYYDNKKATLGFKLAEGESVKLHTVGKHTVANNLQRLLRLYFPIDSESKSNNVMAIVVLPDVLNSVTSGNLRIEGVDPNLVKQGSECSYGKRDLNFEGKKYQFSYILIDANKSNEIISKCIYRFVAISFGIDQIFSDFSTNEQMEKIGMNYILLSTLFDGIQAKLNSKLPTKINELSVTK